MNKILTLFLITITIFLSGCEEKVEDLSVNEYMGYRLYVATDNCTGSELEIYNDGETSYYFPCYQAQLYSIKDSNGTEYTLAEVIQNEFFTIEQLYILFDGRLAQEAAFSYSDERLTFITDEQNLFNQPETDYYVYSFSPNCSHCASIKKIVLGFILEGEHDLAFYIVDRTNYIYLGESALGTGVPIMVHIANGEVTEEFVGTTPIVEFIESQ